MSPPPAAPLGAPAALDALPRRFGRYLLFDRVGKGGMAEIYLARAELEIGGARLCVVKEIHAALSRDPSFSKMFVEEAKLSAGLRHANIAQVVDLGREGDRLFMAMEYVEGPDLLQLLRRLTQIKVPLPLEHAVFVVRETLAALDFAHRATDERGRPLGIVHRDVSPSNVLLSFEGEVKLCDFGIAKATALEEGASDAVRTLQRSVVGKSAYMAPEHARGEAIDARADVFAAGILLWELCAGRRLYRGTEDEMLALARAGDVPRLPARGLPGEAGLATVLERALEKDRGARFSTAREFKEALESWAVGERLMASQIRFGAFLEENVGLEGVAVRREKERAAEAQAAVDPALRAPRGSRPAPPPRAVAPLPRSTEDSTGLRMAAADRPIEETPPALETSVVLASFPHDDDPSDSPPGLPMPSDPPPGLHMPSDPPPGLSTPSEPPALAAAGARGSTPVPGGWGARSSGPLPAHVSSAPPAAPAAPPATSPSATPPVATSPSAAPAPFAAPPPSTAPPPVVVPPGSIEIRPTMLLALGALALVAFTLGFWFFLR